MDKNRDFFDGLGHTITKTARSLGDRFNQELESSKLHGRIAAEEKQIKERKEEIGSLIYSRYDAGEVFDGEMGKLCLEIAEHYAKIRRLEGEFARYRGKKICASCGKEIGTESLFCPFCGVACPKEEEPQAEAEEMDVKEEKIVPFEARREDAVPFEEEPAPEEEKGEAGAEEVAEEKEETPCEEAAEDPLPEE